MKSSHLPLPSSRFAPGRRSRPRGAARPLRAALVALAAGLFAQLPAGVGSAQGLDIDALLKTAAPDPSSLANMLEAVDQRAVDFENQRDVKCWTSFGQLETFVAGADFTPEATHAKTEVVLGYLDQLWQQAARSHAASGAIPAAPFDAALARHFPATSGALGELRVGLGDRTVEVPAQDVRDYEATVEPIRLLRTVTERALRSDPERAPLSTAAMDSAQRAAARIATVFLKEANAVARQKRHGRIQASDVAEAGTSVAAAVGLARVDPSKRPAPATTASSDDVRAAMRRVIKGKIESLDVFNTRYSAEKLGKEFDEDLLRHETQWANRPMSREASRHYKEEELVALADSLYRRAAREHPESDPITGPEMLASITGLYPLLTEYFGVTMLFPNTASERSFWVPEHIADAFRDTAWHWKALDRAVERAEAAGESPPVLDLYAMEELTEFVSIFAVALVQTAGMQARELGQPEVSVAAVEAAVAFVEKNRKSEAAAALARDALDSGRADWQEAAEQARLGLAGAFVAEAFSDVTEASGLDFVHESSKAIQTRRFALYETVKTPDGETRLVRNEPRDELLGKDFPTVELGIAGGGVAVADVNGDGRLDFYLANGAEDRLYLNRGGLRFEDGTRAAGLGGSSSETRGVYFVDYDNDGDSDLFLTRVYSPNRLLRNDGKGRFEDVTEEAGLPLDDDKISYSATWFDFDNDGHLDVYVGHFGDWIAGTYPQIHHSRNGIPNQFFRNRGDGTFVDATQETRAGTTGWAMAVSHFDANGDGWQDLYIANDFGRDELLLNLKGERFFDITPDEQKERALHGMSVGFTDANGDGIEDIYVSNIAMFSFVSKYIKPGEDTELTLTRRTVKNARMVENNVFLVSGDGRFTERQHEFFDRSLEGDGWAWDADFFDFDNDGHDDLYVANGREPNLAYDSERNVLYRQHGGRFFDVSKDSGADIAANSRGVAAADLDDDGDLDLIVNNYHDRAVILRNNLRRNHWVKLHLEGEESNRDAIGARVTVHAGGRSQTRTVRGGSGFLSDDPSTLSFGLGDAQAAERVVIRWPSGAEQVIESLPAGRLHRVREGASLAGARRPNPER